MKEYYVLGDAIGRAFLCRGDSELMETDNFQEVMTFDSGKEAEDFFNKEVREIPHGIYYGFIFKVTENSVTHVKDLPIRV